MMNTTRLDINDTVRSQLVSVSTIGLDDDEGKASLQSLRLLLDGGHDFLGAVEPLLGASLEHELEQRLDAVFGLQGGRAFTIGHGASPLDDLGELFLVQGATALIVARAGARVGIAHGVSLAASDVDWRGGAVLFQLTHPLALDALERGTAGEVKAHDHCIAALVGEGSVVGVLRSCRGVLYSDFAAALACLEFSLVVIERVGGAHAIDEEVLGELDGQGGLATAIIANQDQLLSLRGRHLCL